MNLKPDEIVLASGSPEEVVEFADCDRCAIIDWRGEPEDVLFAFQSFLPESFLAGEFPDSEHVTLRVGARSETIALAPSLPAIPLADAVRRLLLPEYRACLFLDSVDSDTACYLVRPAAWWLEFRSAYPGRFEALFTDADHSQ